VSIDLGMALLRSALALASEDALRFSRGPSRDFSEFASP
jgi:hypothetical protein